MFIACLELSFPEHETNTLRTQALFLADWFLGVICSVSHSQEITRITDIVPRKGETLGCEVAIIKVIRKEKSSYQGRSESAASLNTNCEVRVFLSW